MIVRRSGALASVAEQAIWIHARNPAAADRFLDAVEATLKMLEMVPRAGHRYLRPDDRLEGIRLHPVRRFPHFLVLYRPLENGIEFILLVNGARDIVRALRLR